ncbi:hypothetical protein Tco_1452867 [Tanacetum coccineum]
MDTENKNVVVLEGRPIPSPITHLSFMASQIWQRIVVATTSITAAILIFKSRESKDVDARYSYSPAFKDGVDGDMGFRSRVLDEDDL